MAGPGRSPIHGDLLPVLLRRPDRAGDVRRSLGGQVHDRTRPEQDGLLLGPRGHQLTVSDRRTAADGQELDRLQGSYALIQLGTLPYGHHCSVPNCISQCKLAPCNTITSPLRSLLPSSVGDRISAQGSIVLEFGS